MIKYNLQINNGVEAFGTTGKTISANEVVDTCDASELAREIAHHAEVVSERTAKYVLDNILAAVVQKMSEGKAVVLTLDGKAALRIYPDIHIKGGNINLTRAKELDPEVTDITLDNISGIVAKAGGVTLRAKAEVEKPLTDALKKQEVSLHLNEKKEMPRLNRTEGSGTPGSGNQGGNGDDDNTEL